MGVSFVNTDKPQKVFYTFTIYILVTSSKVRLIIILLLIILSTCELNKQ